ncbi:hypothetical protein BJ166DRAFT_597240 [Pestalotiopsis sp. NC0098]|nr:hypothetical protein BJ166DRAFT_597240 [Pestalotiopsis sp. NC0098]
MTGKVWSEKEERYFWKVVIPRSPKRILVKDKKETKVEHGLAVGLSWDELAAEMNEALKEDARREYKGAALFEHYFLNIEQQFVSPNAGRYVYRYLKAAGIYDHPLLKNSSSARSSAQARAAEVGDNHVESRSPPVQTETRPLPVQAKTGYSAISEAQTTVVFTGVPRRIFNGPKASPGRVLPRGPVMEPRRR